MQMYFQNWPKSKNTKYISTNIYSEKSVHICTCIFNTSHRRVANDDMGATTDITPMAVIVGSTSVHRPIIVLLVNSTVLSQVPCACMIYYMVGQNWTCRTHCQFFHHRHDTSPPEWRHKHHLRIDVTSRYRERNVTIKQRLQPKWHSRVKQRHLLHSVFTLPRVKTSMEHLEPCSIHWHLYCKNIIIYKDQFGAAM